MKRRAALFLSAALLACSLTAGVPAYAEDTSTVTTQESNLTIASSLDGISLPGGSEEVTINYHGTVVYGAKTAEGILLLPVVSDDGSIVWYVFDEASGKTIPYAHFANLEDTFTILPLPDDYDLPEEFTEVSISVNDAVVPAWRNSRLTNDNMYFIYGVDANGIVGLYRFDGEYGLLVRYVEDVLIPESTEPTTTVAPTDNPELVSRINSLQSANASQSESYAAASADNEKTILYGTLIIIGVGALSLILLLVIAILSSKLRSARRAAKAALEEKQQLKAQTNRARREMRSNGEGTGEVRRARPREDREVTFSQSRTTSDVQTRRRDSDFEEETVKPARPVREKTVRPAETVEEPKTQPKKTSEPGEPIIRRRADGTTETLYRRPDGTIVRKKNPSAQAPMTSEERAQARAARRKAAEERKAETEAAETQETEARPAGSVRIVSNDKVTKPAVDELFDAAMADNGAEDENEDFDLTDFRDV